MDILYAENSKRQYTELGAETVNLRDMEEGVCLWAATDLSD